MQNLSNRLRLNDFRLIQAIGETGQIALAAERLAITQPAASRMLAAIEKTVGDRLFSRHPRGMTATHVGEILTRNAVMLLNDVDQAVREIEAVGSGRAGMVRVGTVSGGAVAFVVPAIRKLKRDAQGVDVHVDVAPSDALIDGLMRSDYDFVLCRVPPGIDARQFIVRRGNIEAIRFLVRKSHPLANAGTVTLERLAGFEWVIQAPGTPLRQAVEEAFLNRQVPFPAEVINTTSLLVAQAYIASTDAVSPVSREVAELFSIKGMNGSLAAIDVEEPIVVNAYHLITRRNQVLSPLAMRLRDYVSDALSSEENSEM